MAETAKKPTSNRSTKERRNTLFHVLDGLLSLSHQKIHTGATVTELSRAGVLVNWAGVLVVTRLLLFVALDLSGCPRLLIDASSAIVCTFH